MVACGGCADGTRWKTRRYFVCRIGAIELNVNLRSNTQRNIALRTARRNKANMRNFEKIAKSQKSKTQIENSQLQQFEPVHYYNLIFSAIERNMMDA